MQETIKTIMQKFIKFLDGRIMSGNFQKREYLKNMGNGNFVFTVDGSDDGAILSIPDLGGMMDGAARFPEQEKWTTEALSKIYNVEQTYTTSWKIKDEWAFKDVERLLLENGEYSFISARIEPAVAEAAEAIFECVGFINAFTADIIFNDFTDGSGKKLFFPEFSFETGESNMPVALRFHACSSSNRKKRAITDWPDLFVEDLRENNICKLETVVKNSEYKLSPSDAAALFYTMASGKAGLTPSAFIAIKNR